MRVAQKIEKRGKAGHLRMIASGVYLSIEGPIFFRQKGGRQIPETVPWVDH